MKKTLENFTKQELDAVKLEAGGFDFVTIRNLEKVSSAFQSRANYDASIISLQDARKNVLDVSAENGDDKKQFVKDVTTRYFKLLNASNKACYYKPIEWDAKKLEKATFEHNDALTIRAKVAAAKVNGKPAGKLTTSEIAKQSEENDMKALSILLASVGIDCKRRGALGKLLQGVGSKKDSHANTAKTGRSVRGYDPEDFGNILSDYLLEDILRTHCSIAQKPAGELERMQIIYENALMADAAQTDYSEFTEYEKRVHKQAVYLIKSSVYVSDSKREAYDRIMANPGVNLNEPAKPAETKPAAKPAETK